MKLHLLIGLLLFTISGFAQLEQACMAFGDGSSDDYGYDIIETNDSGYAICGFTMMSAGAGFRDLYITKFDPNGSLEWSTIVGGSSQETGFSLIETSDGNFVAAGETNSYGTGNYDMYIVKTDANGNVLWKKTFGSSSTDEAYDITESPDGGYIICGRTWSFVSSPYNAYIIKLDTDGSLIWSRAYSISGSESVSSVKNTFDNGFILAGQSDTWQNNGGEDLYVIKIDSSGAFEWNVLIGDTLDEVANSIIQTTDSGFVVAGYTNSSGAGGNDVYVVKINKDGTTIDWSTTIGGAGNDIAEDIIQSNDGGFIITGYTDTYGAGFEDVYLIKLDNTGNLIWTKTSGGNGEDLGLSVASSYDNSLLIGGRTGSFGSGARDLLLIKTDADGNSCCLSGSGGSILFPADSLITIGALQGSGGTIDSGGIESSGGVMTINCNSYSICPTADFSSTGGCEGESVLFIDNSLDTVANIVEWIWDYGDGTSDTFNTGNANVHIYDTCGSLYVNLTVVNDSLCSDKTGKYIMIQCTSELSQNVTACQSYFWNGNLYTNTGIYTDTLTNGSQCDSIVTLDLSINKVDTSITISGDSLRSGAVNATYQWLNCDNNFNNITGATKQSFHPAGSGNYAVAVTENNCTDTSACYNIDLTGYREIKGNDIKIYPNPAKGKFTIYHTLNRDVLFEVLDLSGKVVKKGVILERPATINLAGQKNGVYMLKIDGNKTYQLIKQ